MAATAAAAVVWRRAVLGTALRTPLSAGGALRRPPAPSGVSGPRAALIPAGPRPLRTYAAAPQPSAAVLPAELRGVAEVRLIDETGKNAGIVPTEAALAQATAKSLLLSVVNARAEPPVCRLTDRSWGAPRAAKGADDADAAQPNAGPRGAAPGRGGAEAKGAAAEPSEADRKEIRFSTQIGPHDMDVKLKKLEDFLTRGYRIKITVQCRPSEVESTIGTDLLEVISARLTHLGAVERGARPEGRRAVSLLMAPSKAKQGKKPPAAPAASARPAAAAAKPVAAAAPKPRSAASA